MIQIKRKYKIKQIQQQVKQIQQQVVKLIIKMSRQRQANQSILHCTQQQSLLKQQLDQQFVLTLQTIQSLYTNLSKHQQIRIQKWIVKLIQNDQTIRWKKNRNNYLKFMEVNVKMGNLKEPFHIMPSFDKHLTYLNDHQLLRKIKDLKGHAQINHNNTDKMFQHKPEMLKIQWPKGDSCSTLVSIIQTARTQIQNNKHIAQGLQERDMNKACNYKDESKKQNQNIKAIKQHIQQSQAISYPSSTSRLFTNNPVSTIIPLTSKTIQSKVDCNIPSIIPSNLPSNLVSQLPSQVKYHRNNSDRNNKQIKCQVQDYKQTILMMGKILLRHENILSKDTHYQQLFHMIRHFYQGQNDQHAFIRQFNQMQHQSQFHYQYNNHNQNTIDLNQNFINRNNNQFQNHNNNHNQQIDSNNNNQQPFVYITEQSMDFKVEQGGDTSQDLYYQLKSGTRRAHNKNFINHIENYNFQQQNQV